MAKEPEASVSASPLSQGALLRYWLQEACHLSQLAFGVREQSAVKLMDEARRATGLRDFGPEPIERALDHLLSAYRADGRLNLFGRLAARWDNLRLLTNRLILRDRELADPTILRRPVEKPVFIMGLPRSGTSFLHQLLAQDPENEVVRCWQAVYPYPDHPAAGRNAGPDRVQSAFRLFHWIAPELKIIHPLDARAPQECGDITAHSFRSLRFDATYDAPSYRRWIRHTDGREAYRFHRRFLQHLQRDRPRRWVLKWPDHVFAMDALRAVYPDARIVFSHRDPVKVLPSIARLTEVLRRPFVRSIDRLAIGRLVASELTDGGRRMMAAEAARLWPADQVAHVHFKALTADPVATVVRLYDQLGLPFTPDFQAALDRFVRSKPNGGYGNNPGRFEDYGLIPGEQREAFRDYMTCFDVEEEVAVP
jgi:hypothetical protein